MSRGLLLKSPQTPPYATLIPSALNPKNGSPVVNGGGSSALCDVIAAVVFRGLLPREGSIREICVSWT